MIYVAIIGTNQCTGYKTFNRELAENEVFVPTDQRSLDAIASADGTWTLPEKTLGEDRQILLEQVNDKVKEIITGGFDCLIAEATLENGEMIQNKIVRFDSETHDQSNFVDLQTGILSGIAPEMLPVRGIIEGDTIKKSMQVSQEVYRDILKALSYHRLGNTSKGWHIKELMEAAESKEELEAIDWQKLSTSAEETNLQE